MAGMALIEPMDLYNLLNQGVQYPSLSDPNYLLLLGKSGWPKGPNISYLCT